MDCGGGMLVSAQGNVLGRSSNIGILLPPI
jgi:hypothetical protein